MGLVSTIGLGPETVTLRQLSNYAITKESHLYLKLVAVQPKVICSYFSYMYNWYKLVLVSCYTVYVTAVTLTIEGRGSML